MPEIVAGQKLMMQINFVHNLINLSEK